MYKIESGRFTILRALYQPDEYHQSIQQVGPTIPAYQAPTLEDLTVSAMQPGSPQRLPVALSVSAPINHRLLLRQVRDAVHCIKSWDLVERTLTTLHWCASDN